MKQITDIKEFCRAVLRLAGQGYTQYKINEIPEKKGLPHIKKRILKKVDDRYQIEITKDQRYYKKSKGFANYGAFEYRNKIYIFKTEGVVAPGEENGFNKIPKDLNFVISDYLTLILYRDERGKLTFRLSKTNYRSIKEQLKQAMQRGDGAKFHTIQKKIRNLPPYRGIGKQKGELLRYLIKIRKLYRRTYQINLF
jgi:hypothetical protein